MDLPLPEEWCEYGEEVRSMVRGCGLLEVCWGGGKDTGWWEELGAS